MKIAVRKSDNFIMPDFQVPGHADGAWAQLAASRYGGVPSDYLEVEVPANMIDPILIGTRSPVWDGTSVSLILRVKTQVELDAAAAAATKTTLRNKLKTLDFTTVTDLTTARGVLKDLRDLLVV